MAKTYPILYTIKNKKPYCWAIKIVSDGDTFNIVTHHGQVEGKKVEHSKNIPKGKASRTCLEQAELEANRKFINKRDKEGYVDNIKNINKITVRPMLAKTFKWKDFENPKKKGITLPCAIQRKYDGIRCISYINTNSKGENEVILESRQGIPFDNLDLLRHEISYVLKKINKPGFYLDGELYTDKIPFEYISGLVRKQDSITKEELEKMNKIEYHIYDCLDVNNLEWGFMDRYEFIKSVIERLPKKKTSLIRIVPTYIAEEPKDIKKYHKMFTQEGFEGTMLRNIDSPYAINKRPKDLKKYKDFMEEEFKIIGYHDGKGLEKGSVIWEVENKKKDKFSVRPRGSHELRKEFYKNADNYIGKLLTVIFQEYTKDGIPRFPVGKAIRNNY
jgi:ATP-dependent DNA ligase